MLYLDVLKKIYFESNKLCAKIVIVRDDSSIFFFHVIDIVKLRVYFFLMQKNNANEAINTYCKIYSECSFNLNMHLKLFGTNLRLQ